MERTHKVTPKSLPALSGLNFQPLALPQVLLPCPLCINEDFLKVEVKFTQHKINHFKVSNLAAVSAFPLLCNPHLYQFRNAFITTKQNSTPAE